MTANKCPNCGHPFKIQVVPLERLGKGATFQNTAEALPLDDSHIIEQRSNFWANDAVTYSLTGLFAGGVMVVFSWWYEINGGVFIAGIMIVIGVGLHILKIVLHGPPPNSHPHQERPR